MDMYAYTYISNVIILLRVVYGQENWKSELPLAHA